MKRSILETVGNTPIIHLENFSNSVKCEVYAKLENFNPGGSHKVRIAIGMIIEAERRGILKRGSGQTILEPSGGNTGIGLAIAAALFGYKAILVIPDNYSPDKQLILRLYGAEVVLSDSRRGNNSHGEKAMEIQLRNPDYVMLNQQRNPANPDTHRTTTSKEILACFEDISIDCFVGGIGTGGHITGIGECLKQRWPGIRIAGVEPEGCDMINNVHAYHEIQGLSVGLIPDTLNVDIIDRMVRVTKGECMDMVAHIMRTDAISLGISSAANFVAIEKLIPETIAPGSVILTMVYDGVEQYLEYFQHYQPPVARECYERVVG